MAMTYEEASLALTQKYWDDSNVYKNNVCIDGKKNGTLKNPVSSNEFVAASIKTTTIYGGYCETCAYEAPGFRFTFTLPDGRTGSFEIEDWYFGDLMKELLEVASS